MEMLWFPAFLLIVAVLGLATNKFFELCAAASWKSVHEETIASLQAKVEQLEAKLGKAQKKLNLLKAWAFGDDDECDD